MDRGLFANIGNSQGFRAQRETSRAVFEIPLLKNVEPRSDLQNILDEATRVVIVFTHSVDCLKTKNVTGHDSHQCDAYLTQRIN